MECIIATTKSWNIEAAKYLTIKYPQCDFSIASYPDELNTVVQSKKTIDYIFFPHWSWIIPKQIYENYNCVVFHMTDLPFGRGGSPLQNLLVRGIYDTKISAIRVASGIDTGDVYLKEPIDISYGSAQEIFMRVSQTVFNEMIPRFLAEQLEPEPQNGEVVEFKRRTPEQSEIPIGLSQRQMYDYIRMLDGEGYPPAYISTPQGKLVFTEASMENGNTTAKATFIKEQK